MKTIEQTIHDNISIYSEVDDRTYRFRQCARNLYIQAENIPALIEAILPKGKALIDVPEGYEVSEVKESKTFGNISKVIVARLHKLPEPFKFPEHLPDGVKLEKRGVQDKEWCLETEHDVILLSSYNSLARPEDRITIPDWLEQEPRTIVKRE